MAAAQLLLLYRTVEKTVAQYVPGAVLTELDEALGAENLQGIRFEDLMDKSYWAIIFGVALMLVVGLIYAAPIRQSRGADSWSTWRRLRSPGRAHRCSHISGDVLYPDAVGCAAGHRFLQDI